MDRSRLSTILLLVGVFFLVYTLVGKGCGKDEGPNTAIVEERFDVAKLPETMPIGAPCVIETNDFIATIGATGGGLQGFTLKGAKYVEHGAPIDLAHRTTIDLAGNQISEYAPLRASFRNDPTRDNQVPGDLVQFSIEKPDATTCVLRHKTFDLVEIVRTVKANGKPYELSIETTVTNLAGETKRHAFSEALFALQFKKDEGGMFKRPGANDVFGAACAHDGGKLERKAKSDLRKWFVQQGTVDYVAISSAYLGQALIPEDGGAHCALVAQDMGKKDTDTEQSLIRAVLTYEPRELGPNAVATYKQTAFLGPKERHVLAAVAGGGHHVDQLVDLGYFSFIAKYLVSYVVFLRRIIGSWGLAIVLLTVTVRMALLPLTLPQIKSSIAMRRLKPELDVLNKKFEGDQQAKMLATSQLYKKHGVNPLSGCLPALLQMPVWFALYTSLQTAIELYHERFMFWSDLSAPDPRYILPLVLGGTMFLQQKVTPMQMDPAQQKVFTYFMPAMFTVFMLFLPVGLGVYMLTNSVLGIVQTVAVERYMKSQTPAEVKVEVTTTPKGDKDLEKSEKSEKKARPARELVRRPKDEPEA
jgi:YidC/Oxa1 family membrane protein insertase